MNTKDTNDKKTVLRISKNGTKYWINPEKYQARLDREREKRVLNGAIRKYKTAFTRSIPYCHNKKNEAYMRYWEKKCEIRKDYPDWKEMSRNQSKEYYSKVIDLIYIDDDYKEYKYQTRTSEEREDDRKWEEKKRKEEDYDGHREY